MYLLRTSNIPEFTAFPLVLCLYEGKVNLLGFWSVGQFKHLKTKSKELRFQSLMNNCEIQPFVN